MIGIRALRRLALSTLVVLSCGAMISCGGPGSAGVPAQDFQTADEFFAGKFNASFNMSAGTTGVLLFTGTTTGDIFQGTFVVSAAQAPREAIQPLLLEQTTYNLFGVFNQTNGAFSMQAFDPNLQQQGVDSPIPLFFNGQAGGPFTSVQPGSVTLSITEDIPIEDADGNTVNSGTGAQTAPLFRGDPNT